MSGEKPLFTQKTALMRRIEGRRDQPIENILLDLFNSRTTSKVAASELGICELTYSHWLFRLRGTHIGISEEERKQAVEKAEQLYAQGFPLYHICKETGLSIPAIKKHVERTKSN